MVVVVVVAVVVVAVAVVVVVAMIVVSLSSRRCRRCCRCCYCFANIFIFIFTILIHIVSAACPRLALHFVLHLKSLICGKNNKDIVCSFIH